MSLPWWDNSNLVGAAVAVSATEVAVFGSEADLPLLNHIRPDFPDESVRRQAVAAFRDLIRALVDREGVIPLGNRNGANEQQYCLVASIRVRGLPLGRAAFIIRRTTIEAAMKALEDVNRYLESENLE